MENAQLSAQSLAATHNYLRLVSLVKPGERADEHEKAIFEEIQRQAETIRSYIQQIGLISEKPVTAKQIQEKMGKDYFAAPAEISLICFDIINKMALVISAHNAALGK